MRLRRVIDRLRHNGAVITALAKGVSDEQATWRPESGQWSFIEVVNHLADEEVEDFRTRIDATLYRPDEVWTPIEPQRWVTERRYQDRDLRESVERFAERRAESLTWLAGLDAPDWTLSREHPRFGRLSAGDLLTSWVAHDFIHIRQLNRLLRQFFIATTPDCSPDYAGSW